MKIPFTKMQGAGNDFVVLDETRQRYGLRAEHYRFLAHRRFGVGADQILTVRPAPSPDVDFAYVIHNADGGEVEHCGNGARCFVRFVREQGLTEKDTITVQVQRGRIVLHALADGTVRVHMGVPVFDVAALPFDGTGLASRPAGAARLWHLPLPGLRPLLPAGGLDVALVSMGNPHAVCVVDDVAHAPVTQAGAAVQALAAFPASVNVGFMQVVQRNHIRLRVYERGSGETLACGTGACAAVVAGIQQGLLDTCVRVDALGGTLHVDWDGGTGPVWMAGPAVTVFRGEIDVPDVPPPLPQNQLPGLA